jgi:transglutaminase-like putative cysteine protease
MVSGPPSLHGQLLELRVGCRFDFEAAENSPVALMVEPLQEGTLSARWELPAGVRLPDPERDAHGNGLRRIILPPGQSAVQYEATLAVPPDLDRDPAGSRQQLVQELPTETLAFLLPSRYCESDRLMDFAWAQFGERPAGAERVQAVCDWVHSHLQFGYGSTDSHTSAYDVMSSGRGVCRDFTHLAIALCRALTIPTRYAFGYLPDIDVPPPDDPMDFCAWMEVYLEGAWWVFDPRNNARRIGRTLIGRGRDAADVAMISIWGPAQLRAMIVVAEPVA